MNGNIVIFGVRAKTLIEWIPKANSDRSREDIPDDIPEVQ